MTTSTAATPTIYCGIRNFKAATALFLELVPHQGNLERPVSLVIDAPWGYGLFATSTLPRPLLIVTECLSPYYLRDVGELVKPEGLMTGESDADNGVLSMVLERVAKGETVHHGSTCPPMFLRQESAVLRAVALGLENHDIADKLTLSDKTVANTVSALRDKLAVRNRVEMALRYFDMLPRLWRVLSEADGAVM